MVKYKIEDCRLPKDHNPPNGGGIIVVWLSFNWKMTVTETSNYD